MEAAAKVTVTVRAEKGPYLRRPTRAVQEAADYLEKEAGWPRWMAINVAMWREREGVELLPGRVVDLGG